jgi:hypothetical protein
VYVEDVRVEHAKVCEHRVQTALESAKGRVFLRAGGYVTGRKEQSHHAAGCDARHRGAQWSPDAAESGIGVLRRARRLVRWPIGIGSRSA